MCIRDSVICVNFAVSLSFLSHQYRCYGRSCQRQAVADVINTARLRRFRHCCRHRDSSSRDKYDNADKNNRDDDNIGENDVKERR